MHTCYQSTSTGHYLNFGSFRLAFCHILFPHTLPFPFPFTYVSSFSTSKKHQKTMMGYQIEAKILTPIHHSQQEPPADYMRKKEFFFFSQIQIFEVLEYVSQNITKQSIQIHYYKLALKKMSWKYLPVLNSCLQLLITTLFGAVMAKFVPSVFDQTFVSKAVAFVFHVALPCHVLKGIGTKVDFYSETFIWKYIIAFLILRFFALVIAAGSFLLSGKCSKVSIGEITVRWLSLTWISTVILGVPILTSVFNNPGRGLFYGLLAGISSFIFQLPFQLFFFECHKLEREHIEQQGREMEDRDTDEENIVPKESVVKNNQGDEINESVNHWTFWAGLCTSSSLWRDIFKRVFNNPIVVAILCAFIISLSTLGKVHDEIKGLK